MDHPQLLSESVSKSSQNAEIGSKEEIEQEGKIVKIQAKYFLTLIENQKQSQQCLKKMRKEIQTLKARVKKCEQALNKKHKHHHHSHTPQHTQYFHTNEDKIKQLCNKCKKSSQPQNELKQPLYATFGHQNTHKSNSIKRFNIQKSGSMDLHINKYQTTNKKSMNKITNQYWDHPRRKSHSNSKSSWNSDEKLKRLRGDMKEIKKKKREQNINPYEQKRRKQKQKKEKKGKRDGQNLKIFSNIYFSKV